LRRRTREVNGTGRRSRRAQIVVVRLDDGRMPVPAILGGPTDRRTEVLIDQTRVDTLGAPQGAERPPATGRSAPRRSSSRATSAEVAFWRLYEHDDVGLDL
jgi:hypothetical protein